MKNLFYPILAVCLLFSVSVAQSQDEEQIQVPDFTLNDEGEVEYGEVVEQEGSADLLYKRGIKWFKEFYPNANSVFKTRDQEKNFIEGKGRTNLMHTDPETGAESRAGMIEYTIKLMAKDGRYKYEINHITTSRSSYYGLEKWVEQNKEKYRADLAANLVYVDEYMQDLISDLKKFMAVSHEEKEEEW